MTEAERIKNNFTETEHMRNIQFYVTFLKSNFNEVNAIQASLDIEKAIQKIVKEYELQRTTSKLSKEL